MIKPVLVLTLVCAPAAADSNTTYLVDFQSKTSHHALVIAAGSCGEVQVKAPQYESFIRVCILPQKDGKAVRLDIDRRLRENQTESRQSAVVVATSAVSYDWLDGKLTVKTQ